MGQDQEPKKAGKEGGRDRIESEKRGSWEGGVQVRILFFFAGGIETETGVKGGLVGRWVGR